METALRQELQLLMERAGAEALARFRAASPERKADGSVVTEADRAVEAILIEGLTRAFPGDGIVGEEGARVQPRPGAATWYVDPIDGTSAFVGQLAYWGPTVCRVQDGQLDVGAFYVPRLDELWYAEHGGGAWRDGVRLRGGPDVRSRGGDTILFVPSRFHRRGPAPWTGKVRALGTSAAHLALVAAGAGVGAVIPHWSLWDVGCGALLIREAGRMIWDLAGNDFVPEASEHGLPFLAGTAEAMQQLTANGWAEAAMLGRGHSEHRAGPPEDG